MLYFVEADFQSKTSEGENVNQNAKFSVGCD